MIKGKLTEQEINEGAAINDEKYYKLVYKGRPILCE